MENEVKLAVASHVYLIPIKLIRPFKGQPRKDFDEADLEMLSGSMKDYHQQEPIKVRKINDPKFQFELIDGERRYRSAKKAGIELIEGIIRDIKNEDEQFAVSLMLNFGKKRHTDLEAADAIDRLKKQNNMTDTQIARMLGKSLSWVNQRAWLSHLIPKVREMMSPNLPRKQRLPFSSAVTVSKMKPEIQLHGAKLFLNRGARTATALIRQTQQVSVKNTDRTPRKDYEVFRNFLSRTLRDLMLYGELPQTFFEQMFFYRSEEDPQNLKQNMIQIIGLMESLKSTIQASVIVNRGKKVAKTGA